MKEHSDSVDLDEYEVSELLGLYSGILEELRRRKVVRSTNNPMAGYSEYLVSKALNLDLVGKSTTGYDATSQDGKRYEIKGRRITAQNPSRQLSAIRDLPEKHFDYLAGILFDESFSIIRACLIPFEVVMEEAKFREHVNAWILHLRDSIWDRDGVRDITEEIKVITVKY